MVHSTLLAALDAAFQAAVKAEVDAQMGELATKVAALETRLVEAQLTRRTTHIDINAATDALNQQEWFWAKIRSYIDAGIEAATEDFVETGDLPDFGEFVQTGDLPDFDDFVTKDELPELPDADDIVTKDELADLVTENIEGRSFTIRF